MHATVKFGGFLDNILTQAIKQGLAKTKIEALRLSIFELNNRYGLVGKKLSEEEEDVRDIREARKLLKAGKLKLHGEKELKSALSRG